MDGSRETSLGLSNFILDAVILKIYLHLGKVRDDLGVKFVLSVLGSTFLE